MDSIPCILNSVRLFLKLLIFWPDFLRLDLFCSRAALLGFDFEIKQAREVLLCCSVLENDVMTLAVVDVHCHDGTNRVYCVDYERE